MELQAYQAGALAVPPQPQLTEEEMQQRKEEVRVH